MENDTQPPYDEKYLNNDSWFRWNHDQLKFVIPMSETESSSDQIVRYVEDHFGKPITVKYVNNLKYKVVESKFLPQV